MRNRRGSDSELERGDQIAVMEPWPAHDFTFGPDSQMLMDGSAPHGRSRTAMGTTVMGAPTQGEASCHSAGYGASDALAGYDEPHARASVARPSASRLPGTRRVESGYPYSDIAGEPNTRANVVRPGASRLPGTRRVESGAYGNPPAHLAALPTPEGCSFCLPWCPNNAPEPARPDRHGNMPRVQSRDGWYRYCYPTQATVASGYWTDLDHDFGPDLETPDWTEIGAAPASASAPRAQGSGENFYDGRWRDGWGPPAGYTTKFGYKLERRQLKDMKHQWRFTKVTGIVGDVGPTGTPTGTAPAPAATPTPTAQPRSLSSDTLDEINALNNALAALPSPQALAPQILSGYLALHRYDGRRAFYHSKDYGENWGKAMGVLWLLNQLTGDENMARMMINEARDRIHDATSKLRDILG